MKILVWIVGSLAVTLAPLGAQAAAANKNDAQAQDLLRRAATQQNTGTSKETKETPPPAKPAPASAPLVTNIPPVAVSHPTRAELDRQYLEGRMSAKQFQKALDAWMKEEIRRSYGDSEKQRKEAAQRQQQASKTPPTVAARTPPSRATSPKDSAATVAPAASPAPVAAPPPAEPTPQQAKISEVEARIDEMLRQKEAREKAALTNTATATNSVPAGPQTKRQRMDALLRQFVDGTLPEPEYNARRAKILAEPD